MNLEELKDKMAEQDGLRVCPICGLPYKPYRQRQRTCGDPVCRKKHHQQYVKEYNRQFRQKYPEVARERTKTSMRKYRRKQRELEQLDKQLEQMGEHWQRKEEFSQQMKEHDGRYGDIQKQKILASVPKIDVSMGGDNDTVHTEDDTTGS